MLVTGWNLAIAGGGLCGGLLRDHLGAASLAWTVLPLLLLTPCWPCRHAAGVERPRVPASTHALRT